MPCSTEVLVDNRCNVNGWDSLTNDPDSIDICSGPIMEYVVEKNSKSAEETSEYYSSLDVIHSVDSLLSDVRFDLSQNDLGDNRDLIPLVGSHSCGDSILGAVSDTCVSVVINSITIPYLYTTILCLTQSKQACVIHIPAFQLSDSLTMLRNPEHNLNIIKDIGAVILCSDSPQEAYDMTIIAHAEAKRTNLPVIHLFDGITSRQHMTTIQEISSEPIKQFVDMSWSVADTFENYRLLSSRKYSAFEYYGPPNASEVVVMLTHSKQKEAIQRSINKNPSFGILLVRHYRPWNISSFIQNLSPSVRKLWVYKDSNIFSDVAASVFHQKHDRLLVSPFYELSDIADFHVNESSSISIDLFDFPCKGIQENLNKFPSNDISLFRTINSTRIHLSERVTVVNSVTSNIPTKVQAIGCCEHSLRYDDILYSLQDGGILVVLKTEGSEDHEISSQVKESLSVKQVNVILCNSEGELMQYLISILSNQVQNISNSFEQNNSWLDVKESGSFFPETESTAPLTMSMVSSTIKTLSDQTTDANDRLMSLTWRFLFPDCYQNIELVKPEVKDLYHITLTKWVRLTPDSYDRNVFHMEMDISGTGLTYEIGDALGVYGENDIHLVLSFLEMYQLDPNEIIVYKNLEGKLVYRTLQQLLIQDIDLFGRPTKRFYSELATFATNEEQASKLQRLGDGTNAEEFRNRTIECVTMAEIIEEFSSARPSALELIRIIGPIKPRHYSIASSMNAHPNAVHLLVVDHTWVTPKGVQRRGQCTRYLQGLQEGARLCVTVKPSVMKLPVDNETPIVMAGLGTGMAPFRAFIQERIFQAAQGNSVGSMVLYFGSRSSKQEYLYGEEIEAYLASGLLTHAGLAFSRDQKEKVYIQHKIKQDGLLLWDLLSEHKGHFYLCGPTWPVGDVQAAITEIFSSQGKISKDRAEKQIQQMKAAERYILEVY